jgi:hypothetical protein
MGSGEASKFKEVNRYQIAPTAHSLLPPQYAVPPLIGPVHTWDSLITIRQRDSCTTTLQGLFKLFQRPIEVAIKEKHFGVVVAIDCRSNVPKQKEPEQVKRALNNQSLSYPDGLIIDYKNEGVLLTPDGIKIPTFEVGRFMATSYLRAQLCDIFHYYLSQQDFSTCGVQVFFDYKEQHPIQYGAPGQSIERSDLYHDFGEVDTSTPFWYAYFRSQGVSDFYHHTEDTDQIPIALLTLEHQRESIEDPPRKQSDVTPRDCRYFWVYSEKVPVDKHKRVIERTGVEKRRVQAFKAKAKRIKQIKSDVDVDSDQMDLSSWRNPTEEERLASLDSDEECDEMKRYVYVDMEQLRRDIIKQTDFTIDEYVTLFMLCGTDYCKRKWMTPGFAYTDIEIAFNEYKTLKKYKLGDMMVLKMLLCILFTNNVKWLKKENLELAKNGYYKLKDIQQCLQKRIEMEETKRKLDEKLKKKTFKPYQPKQFIPIDDELQHSEQMIDFQLQYYLAAAKAEYNVEQDDHKSSIKEQQVVVEVVTPKVKCDGCGSTEYRTVWKCALCDDWGEEDKTKREPGDIECFNCLRADGAVKRCSLCVIKQKENVEEAKDTDME